ncbi:MAG: PKD domain-containing protein [Gemmatimonadales bacterium]
MHRQFDKFATAAIIVLLAAACQGDDSTGPAGAAPVGPNVAPPGLAAAATDRTPLQQALQETMARRAALGLPVPSARFEYGPLQPGGPMMVGPAQARQSTVVATTVLRFDGPAQAGYAEWPRFVVRNKGAPPQTGFIREGDYTALLREKTAAQIPGVWSRYEFGHEPRTYTLTETLTLTQPDVSLLASPDIASVATSAGAFLLGFSVPGPNLDYTIDFAFETCVGDLCVTVVDFVAGFRLDWALGLRLPINLSLTSTEPLLEGSISSPASLLNGLNWTAADYTAAGVPAEDGNEYVTRFVFLLGVFLEVAGVDVINVGPNINIDETRDFTTPFGPGATFALPNIDVPVWTFDITVASLSAGFRVTPHAGSDRFTAAWAATGEASGGGNLTYTSPALPVDVGPLTAIDGPGVASVRVDAMRYFFTEFLLDLGLFVHLDVFGIVGEDFTVPVTDFDISSVTGGLFARTHAGTPGAFQAAIAIANVTPTVQIDRTGTTLVNGVPTFVGQPASFIGTATDPGRDDLDVTWNWGDGSPDAFKTYPVPHLATDEQVHTFSEACLYTVTLTAEDDDAAVGQDQVPVLLAAGGGMRTAARLEGYWQHQLSEAGRTRFGEDALACYLKIVEFASQVFNEERSIATIGEAFDVLHLARNGSSLTEQLDRELLVTWLNFANGTFGYDELVDENQDGVSDRPYAQVMASVEAVRLDGGASPAQLEAATALLHGINASRTATTE